MIRGGAIASGGAGSIDRRAAGFAMRQGYRPGAKKFAAVGETFPPILCIMQM